MNAYVRKPAGNMPSFSEKILPTSDLADIYAYLVVDPGRESLHADPDPQRHHDETEVAVLAPSALEDASQFVEQSFDRALMAVLDALPQAAARRRSESSRLHAMGDGRSSCRLARS